MRTCSVAIVVEHLPRQRDRDRERDRDRDRVRDRDSETETERQRDRERQRETDRQIVVANICRGVADSLCSCHPSVFFFADSLCSCLLLPLSSVTFDNCLPLDGLRGIMTSL
jgi:hypothetical protein